MAAAEAEGLPYQLEAEPGVTGTDARAIQMARGGIPTGLVSVPLRYMHTPTEVVCLADLDATVKLVVRFALDLGEDACFVPGMAGASPLAREEAADDAELAAQAAADAPAHETAAQRRFDETGAE